MAICPNCDYELSLKQIFFGKMICPSCAKKLYFNKKEYKNAGRPGIYIAFVFLFNGFINMNPYLRIGINILLLLLWAYFFRRYLQYLKAARLEVDE